MEIQQSNQMYVSNSYTSDGYFLTIGSTNSSLLTYGMQQPQITFNTPSVLVTDDTDPGLGPVYFFQKSYDTLVVLPESADVATQSTLGPNPGVVLPGDQPWFCFWNQTLLEVFIYSNLTSSLASVMPSASASTPKSNSTTGLVDVALTSVYPKAVKVENSVQDITPDPYCQRMEIADDGMAVRMGAAVQYFNISTKNGADCSCTWWSS
jgi:hypothetical protein